MNPYRTDLPLRVALICAFVLHTAKAQEPVSEYEGRGAKEWAAQLESKQIAERRKAVYALYQLGPSARPFVRPIGRRLRDEDKYVRDTTERILARWQFGTFINVLPPALPELLEALGDERAQVRIAGINLLWKTGPIPNVVGDAPPPKALVPALAKALADSEPKVRANAAACLLNVAKHAGAARPALAKALEDDDATVRLWAMRAAPVIDAQWAGALALGRIGDPDAFVRGAAAAALGQLKAPVSVEFHAGLERLLEDKETTVQIAAVDALWSLGDSRAARRLTQVVVGDGDPGVRGRAAMALGGIGDPSAVPTLVKALKDSAASVRSGAVSGLGRLGPEGAGAMKAMIKLLDGEDQGVRSSVVMAASGLAPWAEAAIPGIVKIASAEDSPERNMAMSALYAMALAEHRDPRMLACAIAALDGKDRSADVYAIQIVAAFGTAAGTAAPTLKRLLAADSGWNERRSLYWTIAAMREAAVSLESVLKTEFENEDGDRMDAAMALACVSPEAATRERAVAHLAEQIAGDRGIEALVKLQRVGSDARSGRVLIRTALETESNRQPYAGALLLQFGGEDATRAHAWFQEQLADTPSRMVLNAVADAGPAAKALAPALLKIALDPSHERRDAALRAMRQVGAGGDDVQAAYALARKDASAYTRTLGALGLRSLR